jgi:hypothetical protein
VVAAGWCDLHDQQLSRGMRTRRCQACPNTRPRLCTRVHGGVTVRIPEVGQLRFEGSVSHRTVVPVHSESDTGTHHELQPMLPTQCAAYHRLGALLRLPLWHSRSRCCMHQETQLHLCGHKPHKSRTNSQAHVPGCRMLEYQPSCAHPNTMLAVPEQLHLQGHLQAQPPQPAAHHIFPSHCEAPRHASGWLLASTRQALL